MSKNYLTAKEAQNISLNCNREYDDACVKFSKISDENMEDFKEFILSLIEIDSKIGCLSLAFEIKEDSIYMKDIVDFFISLGYKVNFYKLNESYSNAGYCLSIYWN